MSENITYDERNIHRLFFKAKKWKYMAALFFFMFYIEREKKHDLPKLGAIIVVQ